MNGPQTLPYPKIIEYSNPSDLPFDALKKVTALHPVFLSSRFTGMEQLRKLLAEKFAEYGYPVKGWELGENFGSTQKRPPRDVYLDALKKSKVYCGVLDTSYGPDIIEDCSATEDEYNHAIQWNHDLCLLTGKTEPKEDKTKDLITKWRRLHTVSPFANEVELVSTAELFIKNHILKIGMNWVMIGDVILPSGYKTTIEGLSVEFSTANSSVVGYLKRFSRGQEIGFIDLSDGIRLDLEVDDIQFKKLASSVWSVEARFKRGPAVIPMSWHQWSQIKDMRLTKEGDLDLMNNGDIGMISGLEHIPQAIKLTLNINRGQRVMRPEMGSNLYNILDAYGDYPELAELLIKLDVIETLTRPIKNLKNEVLPAFPCIEKVDIQQVSNIKKHRVDLKLRLFLKDRVEPFDCETTVKWEKYE